MAESTRQAILDCALDLFYQHGFTAIGVDRIAKQAGVTRQTLYNHFESKDRLVLQVIQQRDAWWRRLFREEVELRGGDDPVRQLRSVYEILREAFTSDGFYGCMFINAASEFPSPHDPAHRAAKANADAIREILAEIAARAGFQEPDQFAEQFHMIIEGAIVTEVIDRAGRAPDTAAKLADTLIEAYTSTATAVG